MACSNNNVLILELLMKYGANPNIITNDEQQSTTMIQAASTGNIDLIKMLLNVNNKYKYSFNWVCF